MAFHGRDHKKISNKISKIMHEGVRGKKVSKDQAIAIAFSMSKKKGRKKIKSKKRK